MIIAFSDTHLTKKFDKRKFNFLLKIIKKAKAVRILGDFWEGHEITFDEFLESEWNGLFKHLQKKTVYIYGNHDPEYLSDKRVSLFCKKATITFKEKIGKQKYEYQHGHLIAPTLEMKRPIIKKKLFRLLHEYFDRFGVKMLGPRFFKKGLIGNRKLLNYARSDKKRILVCGHTHYQTIKENYANTGFVNGGHGQYLVITDSGCVMKKEKYV